ncbi:MAG: hypothetical protein IT244_13485 [Bacteroidia bacterium]|nr:hypothetical protein [Bacteroidia bacterium]
MISNRTFLLIIGIFFCNISNAQLLAPRRPTSINLIVEAGCSVEMKAENSTQGFINGSVCFVAGNIFLAHATVFNGTRSKIDNQKSNTSLSYILEGFVGNGAGLYVGYDYGLRNYRFESVAQYDAETGASSAQPNAQLYTPEEIKPNVVIQHALPAYRIGLSSMFNLHGKELTAKEGFIGQFAIFGSYSPKATQANALFSESSLYNINVPTAYSGESSDIKASKRGFGFLLWGQSYYGGIRSEIGWRPTLYKNYDGATNAEKGFYFNFGFSLRLI